MKAKACTGFVVVNAMMVFNVLLILKAEKSLNWSWYVVAAPFWLAIVFMLLLVSIAAQDAFGKDSKALGASFWIQSSIISFFVWSVFLVVKLEAISAIIDGSDEQNNNNNNNNNGNSIYVTNNNNSFIKWSLVFIPCWISLLLLLVVDENFISSHHKFHTPINTPPSYISVLPTNIVTAALIFTLLHVLHLEGALSDNLWKIRYIPIWYLIVITVVLVLTKIQQADKKLLATLWSFLCFAPVVSFLLLLYFYLVGTIASLAVVCIPLFIIEVVLWFLACIFPLST